MAKAPKSHSKKKRHGRQAGVHTKKKSRGQRSAAVAIAPVSAKIKPTKSTAMEKSRSLEKNSRRLQFRACLRKSAHFLRTVLSKSPAYLAGAALLLLYAFTLFLGVLPSWLKQQFGGVSMDSLLFHLMMPQEGTPSATYLSFVLYCILPPLLIVLFTLLLPRWLRRFSVNSKRARSLAALLALFLGLGGVGLAEFELGIFRFLWASFQQNSLIEEYYVDPKTTSIVFPEQKRNLIFIWAESMEASFQDTINGGCMPENIIEPLTELSKKHTSFSINGENGGFLPVNTANFTIGAMTVQSSGLPFITPLSAQNETPEGAYMPGMCNLGDVLKREGYQNVFLSGSNADFGRQQELFIQHGDYAIHDLKWMYRTAVVPRDYYVWWGVEDSIVLETAKDELSRLSQNPQAFNLQLELMDTHAPGGYLNSVSSKHFDEQYSNVLAGSAQQIKDFVDWCLSQPWGDNTSIIVVGDHFTMDGSNKENFVQGSRRSIYNCFIQSAAKTEQASKHHRLATSLDIFPTTLAALGANISGDKLALGVNLFSGKKTLAEELGLAALNQAFNNRSDFYEQKFLSESWLRETVPSS